MDLPHFLERRQFGEIGVSGHRIDLYHLVYFFNQGESAQDLSRRFPTLSLSLIEKVLAFYETNKMEVDAYVAACQAEIDRQHALPRTGPTLDELRERMRSLHPKKIP